MSLKKDLDLFKPRKEQQEALDFIIRDDVKNPDNKYVLLDLPVGVGKSHLALMIADWYKKKYGHLSRIDIVTNSKLLQDQYASTYRSINDLRGKENYECESYECSCASGSEFNRINGTECEACPYSTSRENYINGGVSLTNFHLFIIFAMYNEGIRETRNSKVLIVDECHDFDDIMTNFLSIKITEEMINRYEVNEADVFIRSLSNISSVDSYFKFLKGFNRALHEAVAGMTMRLENSKSGHKSKDIKILQLLNEVTQLISKIEIFLVECEAHPNNWVVEKNYNEKTKSTHYSIEPIWASGYLNEYVFKHYDKVFLMSGTILDKNLFSMINGLDATKASYYRIESPFPLRNRPVYYVPIGKMSFANKKATFAKYVPTINKILKKYHDKKGIIHTNSFELSNWISDGLRDNGRKITDGITDERLIFHDSSNKDLMLEKHKNSELPSVIVSPSMDTGVSFDDEYARFQIIAKIPYPSLASEKNKARMKNVPNWYTWKTVVGLIQMLGRPVRSMDDYADTIILDESFSDLIRNGSNYMPEWVQNAIKSFKK